MARVFLTEAGAARIADVLVAGDPDFVSSAACFHSLAGIVEEAIGCDPSIRIDAPPATPPDFRRHRSPGRATTSAASGAR